MLLAVHLTRGITGTKLWIIFIGGSGHTKSELIRALDDERLPSLMKQHGFDLSRYGKSKRWQVTILVNCVKPELGLHIFNCAFKIKQENLLNLTKGGRKWK